MNESGRVEKAEQGYNGVSQVASDNSRGYGRMGIGKSDGADGQE